MRINSIRFKISILYTLILGVILIIHSGILYFSLQLTLYSDLDDELRMKAGAVCDTINTYTGLLSPNEQSFLFAARRAISKEGEYPEQDRIMASERQWLQRMDRLDIENDYVVLLGPAGEILAGAGGLSAQQLAVLSRGIKSLPLRGDSLVSVRLESRNLRLISRPVFYNGGRYIIQVGTSLKPIIEILKDRLSFIVLTIPFILIFTSIIGRFLVTKILEPVKQITATAKKITHEDLNERVQTGQIDEEMKYLVDTFNDMIERLEKSFEYISEFSSHVAHEIKTPLAIIRGEAELALRREREPAEYRRVLQGSLEEIRRILKLIDDLLLLTRLQHQREIFNFENFDIEQFLREFYEQSRILASQKNISINLSLPGHGGIVNADKTHLRRLFFNLMNNAVKFTPPQGRIGIGASYSDKKVSVVISDTGIGIPCENLPKVFDKFFHSNGPNSNLEPGTGLGLNISLAIARIHNGDILARSRPREGAVFTVILPLAR